MYTLHIVVGIFTTINLLSFLTLARDKRKSIRGNGRKRTPEGIFFFLASCFGAIGIHLGMLAFRHKTKKWYFQLGIPLLMLQNIATLYAINSFLNVYQL